MLRRLFLAALFVSTASAASAGTGLVEPTLKMTPQHDGKVRVAMTLDACMGKTDHRILDTLVKERIPATIFVTARWLKHNSEALAVLTAHPDLFEIENHGENHGNPQEPPGTHTNALSRPNVPPPGTVKPSTMMSVGRVS